MQKIILASLLATAALAVQAQEMGRVLSSTPIIQQVAVPQQVCGNETIYSSGRAPSGAGAVLGAIAGGAAGNAQRHGTPGKTPAEEKCIHPGGTAL